LDPKMIQIFCQDHHCLQGLLAEMLLLATMLLMTISTQHVNALKMTSILHVQYF
jgi:hypothetical protein